MRIDREKPYWIKIHIDCLLLLFITLLLIYSTFITWSATDQNYILIRNKVIQIIFGLITLFLTAQIAPKVYEEWAPYIYLSCTFLLILVNFFGKVGNGAKRWLDLGIFCFQPSEVAKIAVPLMIARFLNRRNIPPSLGNILISLKLILIPTLLVVRQPDLGTAILIVISGLFVLFLSGVRWKLIMIFFIMISIFVPWFWFFLMHEYQRNRIMTLLCPETDPFGSGYHIIQSKIAIGSGGVSGKGWLLGTQSHLSFLPEKHTDFIFAVISEELGLIGSLVLLFLYFCLISRGLIISIYARDTFSRIIVGSLTLVFFFYVFINIGMVSGILPIVGIPLPLISYGGSSLVVLMAGFGIIMSVQTNKRT